MDKGHYLFENGLHGARCHGPRFTAPQISGFQCFTAISLFNARSLCLFDHQAACCYVLKFELKEVLLKCWDSTFAVNYLQFYSVHLNKVYDFSFCLA